VLKVWLIEETLTNMLASAGFASIYFELRSISEGAMPSAMAELFD